jgi:DNA-binding CsgD family transcriptional regulator
MNVFYIPGPQPFWFVGSELLADLLHAELTKVNVLGRQDANLSGLFDTPGATELQRKLCFAVLAHGKVLEIISELFASRYEPGPQLSDENSKAFTLTSGLVTSDAPDWVLEMDRFIDRLPVHLKDALPDALQAESYNANDSTQISSIESAIKTLDSVESLQTWIEEVLDTQFQRLSRRWTPVTTEIESENPKSQKPRRWLKGTEGLKRKADLSRYWHGLTQKQELAASLKWEYGLRVSEIAVRMGIDRSTVAEHLDAANKKIKEHRSNDSRKAHRAHDLSE